MHCSGFYCLQFLTTVKNQVTTPLRPFDVVTTALSHRHYGPLRTPLGRFHFVTTALAPVELTPYRDEFQSPGRCVQVKILFFLIINLIRDLQHTILYVLQICCQSKRLFRLGANADEGHSVYCCHI